MQVIIINVFLFLNFYNFFCSSDPKSSVQDSLIFRDNAEDLRIKKLKSKIEENIVSKDLLPIIEGVDSLLEILGTSSSLYHKSEIAKYLAGLPYGEEVIFFGAKSDDYEQYRSLILMALRHPENLCFRIGQLLEVSDGRLLRVVGSETAAIAMLTHYRALFISDMILNKLDENGFKDFLHDKNTRNRLSDYYDSHCAP